MSRIALLALPVRHWPPLLLAASPAPAHDQDRARGQPGRHRGLAGARDGGAADRDANSRSTAAPTRTRPTSPASPIWRRPLLDEGAGELDAKAFQERLERNARSSSAFTRQRDHFRGSLRILRDRKDEGFELLRLALTAPRFDAERGRAHPRADADGAAARDHQARTTSPAGCGGARRFPIIPMAGRSTARWNRCRGSRATI